MKSKVIEALSIEEAFHELNKIDQKKHQCNEDFGECSWDEEFFDHPLCSMYEQVCDDLGVSYEPSTQGRMGFVEYIDQNDDKVLYKTNFSNECDFMDDLGYSYMDGEISEEDVKEKIKEFITKHPYKEK